MIVRGLTLWRPWDAAILEGPKDVENRPRRWNIAGTLLAFHAGQRFDARGARFIREHWPEAPEVFERPSGVIVGAARVREVCTPSEVGSNPWAFGPYCYVLEARVAFAPADRIPLRGRQGLFKLPPEIESRVVDLWGDGEPR